MPKGFLDGSTGKESIYQGRRWIQSLGQEAPLEKKWQPSQHSCLTNPMDRGAQQAIAFVVTELDPTEQLTQGQVGIPE